MAIALENFFERPFELGDDHNRIYRILTRLFYQDPTVLLKC